MTKLINSRVSIIVLNWNGWEHTIRCLATLFQSTYVNYEVVLIDNASEAISLQKIHEWIDGRIPAGTKVLPEEFGAKPAKVYEYRRSEVLSVQNLDERASRSLTIIRSEENLGFAGGCNLGMKFVLKDRAVEYVFLLNNDMEINKDCIERLVAEALVDRHIGACQPKILLSREKELIDALGIFVNWFGYTNQIGHGKHDSAQYSQTVRVFGACGGAALYRREMLEDIGLLDEDFFAYYEDVDLALRARKAGWLTVCVQSAVAHHYHSASLGEYSPRTWYYCVRNGVFFVVKNLSFISMLFFFCIFYPVLILSSIYRTGGNRESFRYIFRGVRDGLKGIPRCLKKRYGAVNVK